MMLAVFDYGHVLILENGAVWSSGNGGKVTICSLIMAQMPQTRLFTVCQWFI
jgi:hypothetical protein